MLTARRLVRAAGWGALLATGASCGGESSEDPSGTGGLDAGGTGGTGGALVDAAVEASLLPTEPYPLPAGCGGTSHEGGYWGQCCELVGCVDPDGGVCPPLDQARNVIPGYPPGSGSCACAEPQGPFAPRAPDTQGACCYLYSSIGCDGRPLLVAGAARRATLVQRSDWARVRPLGFES